MNNEIHQDKQLSTLDEEECAWRAEVLEDALTLYAERGFSLDDRCRALCEAFQTGQIELEEFRRQVLRPYVH